MIKGQSGLEVGRVERIVALVINSIVLGTFLGGPVNWYLYASSGRTIGSIVMNFATLNEDGSAPGFGGSIKFFFVRIAYNIITMITLSIFFWIDMATLENRNGNFKEVWAGQYKKMN